MQRNRRVMGSRRVVSGFLSHCTGLSLRNSFTFALSNKCLIEEIQTELAYLNGAAVCCVMGSSPIFSLRFPTTALNATLNDMVY